MKKVIIVIIVLLLAVVVFAWLRVYQVKTKNTITSQVLIPVKIGYMAFASNWPVFLAQEGKFFEKEGIKAQLVSFSSGVDAANALSRGDISSMAVNPLTDLMNIEARSPGLFKIYAMQQSIASGNYTDTLLINKDSPIQAIKNLENKKIGVNPGTFAAGMIKILLDAQGIKNVTFVQLAPNLQLQALSLGQIDALVAYEPGTTIALSNGSAKILIAHPFENVMNPFPNVAFTISAKTIKENPQVAKKIINAMEKAMLYGRINFQTANEATAKYVTVPIDILNKMRYPDQVLGKEINQKKVQEVADLFFQKGLAPQKINVKNLFYVQDEKIR